MSRLAIPVSKYDHFSGNKKAPVTLVEYGDYECPYCGEAFFILKQLQKDIGNLFVLVFRNFPLSQIHPHALHAAWGAEAAAEQKKFWEMHDMLYEYQENLEDEDIVGYADSVGLDLEQFVEDMNSESVHDKVQDDFMGGVRSGVNGTPTFFLNGLRHDASYDYTILRAAIEKAARGKKQ